MNIYFPQFLGPGKCASLCFGEAPVYENGAAKPNQTVGCDSKFAFGTSHCFVAVAKYTDQKMELKKLDT